MDLNVFKSKNKQILFELTNFIVYIGTLRVVSIQILKVVVSIIILTFHNFKNCFNIKITTLGCYYDVFNGYYA